MTVMDDDEYQKMVKRCLRCSICKWIPQLVIKSKKYATVCPAIDMYNFHSYSGGGKIILANSLARGRIKPTEELRDLIYKCTECGGCAIACKYLNTLEPLEIITRLREILVESGYGPMPKQQEFIDAVKSKHNPYNEPHEKRFDWIPGDIKLNENAETVYFVGCSTSYRIQKNAITTMRILNAAGVDFKVLGSEEFCCGSPVIRTGDKKSFIDILNVNMDKIEAMGIKTMLFSCAGCYDTFKVEYPIYRKFDVTLLSTIEFFERLIDDGRIKLVKDVPLTVTYHDPCHLGRNNELYEEWDGDTVPMIPLVSMNVPPKPKRCGSHGVYDAPRNILEKIPGLKLVEMERIREYSYCCGAGGGVKAAFPEFALNTAETRLEEAEDTGAETLVSDCPFCEMNLKDGIKARDSSLKYYDISEILAMAMGIIDATKNGGVSD